MTDTIKLLDQAISAAKRKDKATARTLVQQILNEEPNNLNAWLLMAHVVETREESIRCFDRVLQLNPDQAYARERLAKLKAEASTPTSVPSQSSLPQSAYNTPTPSLNGPSESHPKRSSSSGKGVTWIIMGGIVVLFICLVVFGVGMFNSGGSLLETGQPTPTTDELFSVLYRNARAANEENLEAYMATIHPSGRGYRATENTMRELFPQYDLQSQYYNLELVSLKRGEAQIHYYLYTKRLRGPDFRNNTLIGVITLRPDNGVWKIYKQTVEDTQFE